MAPALFDLADPHSARQTARDSGSAPPGLDSLGEAARVRLAADTDTPAEILRQLAQDDAVTVRATLALNPAAADHVMDAIAADPDDRVRALLAQRLALLLPRLSDRHRDDLQQRAQTTLMTLAVDQAVRVRAAIAEVVKDLPHVPHTLILQLAQDMAVSVSEPVIRLSPLLTTEDLLALVAAPATQSTVTAVARRPHLTARIADAIADCPDPDAIAALIANQSAAIGEATLDSLIVRAVDHVAWHLPLIRRRHLSLAALRALAELVTGQVLSELAERTDLSAALAQEIAVRIGPALAVAAEPTETPAATSPRKGQALQWAREMAEAGSLNEEALLAAARRGEARLCSAMLAVAADVLPQVVERAVTLRSGKGLLSLIWRAHFSMRVAGPLQSLLTRLPPESLLTPNDTGGFPLSIEEMRWQIEFLSRIGRD